MAKSTTGSSEALRDRKICFRLTSAEYDRFRFLVEAEYGTAANAASRFIREHIFLENNVKMIRQIWSDTRAMKADIELLMRQLQHQNNFPAYSRLSDILTKTELQLDRIGRLLSEMDENNENAGAAGLPYVAAAAGKGGDPHGNHQDHEHR